MQMFAGKNATELLELSTAIPPRKCNHADTVCIRAVYVEIKKLIVLC